MNAEQAFANAGSPSECVDYLIDLIRRGELLDEFRRDPLCVFTCISKIITGILEKLHNHDHDVPIGSDGFTSKCELLASELKCQQPVGGIIDGALLRLLLSILLAKLEEIVKDLLDR